MRALFNEIATPGDGARDGRLLLRIDQTNGWAAPMSWKAPVRFCVSVVVAALLLTGCNANLAINPSGQADRCANDAGCDPYNPISYAQNNTGNRGGGGGR